MFGKQDAEVGSWPQRFGDRVVADLDRRWRSALTGESESFFTATLARAGVTIPAARSFGAGFER
jgi:hypothetical protein